MSIFDQKSSLLIVPRETRSFFSFLRKQQLAGQPPGPWADPGPESNLSARSLVQQFALPQIGGCIEIVGIEAIGLWRRKKPAGRRLGRRRLPSPIIRVPGGG